MFNVYSYEKKRSSQLEHERKLKLSVGNQGKVKAYRDKLYENYSKRISDFLFHMERQPIIINSFHSPIENAGRMTDPSKFKGKAQIIVRDYKTHKERLQESLKYASIHIPNISEKNPPIRASHTSKDLKFKEKRMYFKPKNNLERVVDELKSRNYNVTDYNTKRKSQFPLKKSWVALPAFAQLPDSDKDSDDSKSEEIVPKQILAGLHNKTYFKGVTSLIAKPDLHKSLNPNIEPLANSVLKSCNVKPKEVHSVFLKAGNGRLVSNPEESILDTYEKLKISMKTQ